MTADSITVGDWGIIQIKRFSDASKQNIYMSSWSGAKSIPYSKYSIKESDMRVKTANFTSPQYLDLTTGLHAIRIISKYHENFAGIVLDVDYDEDNGLYTYQCQDFSRLYMDKFEAIFSKIKLYNLLKLIISSGKSSHKNKFSRKGVTGVLSGLRALKKYDQSIYPNQHYKGNPFNKNVDLLMRDKSRIEVIRSIVFNSLGFYDVYFNDRGILQIEPLSRTDWESTGLHLSSTEYANRKFKFSTANAITSVWVNASGDKVGKKYTSKDLTKLDLKAFFGTLTTSISDPVQKSASKKNSNAVKNKNNTGAINSDNPYGTKRKVVYMNIDLIDGYSSDQNKMNRLCDILHKHGWECHTCGVGSESHYERRGEVNNGIWLTLYGGACAGTLRETATNDWFRRPIVNHGSRTVVGFFPPAGDIRKGGKYYSWLPRAHDDGFSGNFSGVSYPAKMLTNAAVPFMYAKNPSEMASKFLKGGDNPEACNKNWKFYSR